MELQFDKTKLSCLEKVVRQVQDQELTQERKLEENFPDISKVLGAWGQVILRSKEWQGGSVGVSGGVMAWVLYAPEGQEPCRCVQTWVPFQMKWDFPESKRDGSILTVPLLRSIDARSTSARKLMIRMDVSVLAEAWTPGSAELFVPPQLPEDICLLTRNYPMMLPTEAGEKSFLLEETLNISPSDVPPEMIVHYHISPELADQKIVGDKVVFRGGAVFQMLYRGEDGAMHSFRQEIPFSQFSDLDHEYGEEATAMIIPVVTAMELEKTEAGQYKLKAGFAGQYVIYDRPQVQIVEDAYSPMRSVIPQTELLQLPVVLDHNTQTVHAEKTVPYDGNRVVDVTFYPEHPMALRDQNGSQAQLGGKFHILYYGEQGMLEGDTVSWDGEERMPAAEDVHLDMIVQRTGTGSSAPAGGDLSVQSDILLQTVACSQQGIPMVTGLDMTQELQQDPERPSLILQRCQGESLWELAKTAGSTVEAIRQANALEQEPAWGQMLLIPVK